jgi:hypothetical protein
MKKPIKDSPPNSASTESDPNVAKIAAQAQREA